MKTQRSHLAAAGALLLVTGLVGAAARGAGRTAVVAPPANGKTTFAAPTTGPVSFSGTLDRTAVLLGRDGVARIELAIAAAPDDSARNARKPTDVVIGASA